MLKAMLVGNIGNDPELRYSAQGDPILRFNVKVARDGRVYGSVDDRLLAHSVQSEGYGDPPQPIPCLLTTYALNDGYGQFTDENNKTARVHIVAYRLWVGPVPDGHEVTHLCNVRRCFEPTHLVPGTTKQNAEYKAECGRSTHSDHHPKAKLTTDQVRLIRVGWGNGISIRRLARDYGVSRWSVENIVNGKTWRRA